MKGRDWIAGIPGCARWLGTGVCPVTVSRDGSAVHVSRKASRKSASAPIHSTLSQPARRAPGAARLRRHQETRGTPKNHALRLPRLLRPAVAIGLCIVLTGCAGTGFTASGAGRASERADLTPAQECAIGYDMARRIYELARVSETVIRVSPDLGACGKYAARYLRQAGFAVDETATRRDAYVFAVRTYEDPGTQAVIATAALPGLQLTRAYRRSPFGVTPASSFNVIREGGNS